MTQLDIFAALTTAAVLTNEEPIVTDAPDTFEIPAERLGYLERRIAELVKRASKLALDVAIGFVIVREFVLVEKRRDALGEVYEIQLPRIEVRVFGEAPKLNGWTLCGRFDYQAIPGAVMRAMVPGETSPLAEDPPSTRCDACGHARHRNDTFLLRHENGRYVVVGRSCLKDYLGHVSPAHVASMAAILAEVSTLGSEDAWGSDYAAPDAWTLVEVLTLAAYSVRSVGWAPSSFDERSTRSHVTFLLCPSKGKTEKERQAQLAKVSSSDAKKAANTIAWLRAELPNNDYMHNLCAIASVDIVTDKALGIAVSGILAYDRAMERETNRREAGARDSDSVHVGEIKGRREFTLDVETIRHWESDWGVTTFIKMRDEAGNVLVWKASNSPDVETGDKLRIKGTVKAHDVYTPRDTELCINQTVLTRCKILEILEPGPDRANA
jgi:hypothetical protein